MGNAVINRRGFLGRDISGYGAIQILNDKIVISTDDFETYNTLLSGNGLYLERQDKKS